MDAQVRKGQCLYLWRLLSVITKWLDQCITGSLIRVSTLKYLIQKLGSTSLVHFKQNAGNDMNKDAVIENASLLIEMILMGISLCLIAFAWAWWGNALKIINPEGHDKLLNMYQNIPLTYSAERTEISLSEAHKLHDIVMTQICSNQTDNFTEELKEACSVFEHDNEQKTKILSYFNVGINQ